MQNANISELQPQLLWKHFQKICSIPHPSYHTDALSEYIINFGKSLGYETRTDKTGNILIRKPSSPGYESAPTIALQAHIDMVPQKNKDTAHYFEIDPIDIYIDNEWITPKKRTVAEENGMGAA